MTKSPVIYLVSNQVNGKLYIGATVQPSKVRWAAHVHEAKKGSKKSFQQAIRKHGVRSFKVTELFCVLDKKHLCEFEKYFIGVYGSYEHGYNSTLGGAGIEGFKHSEETKQAIAEASTYNHAKPEVKRRHKANCTHGSKSESHKRNISVGRKQMLESNDQVRNRLIEIARKAASDPALNKQRSSKVSAIWNKPGERERRSEAIKAALARKKQSQLNQRY